MCLSTAYMNSGNEQKEIMKDIARIEAEGQGFWLINLFGEKKFVEGSIQSADLLDGRLVLAGISDTVNRQRPLSASGGR
jgi:predicted RNA-binding protein